MGTGGSEALRSMGGTTRRGLPEAPLPDRRCGSILAMVGLVGVGVSIRTAPGRTNSAIGEGGVMFGGRPWVTSDMAGGDIEGGDIVATAAAAMLFVLEFVFAVAAATGTGAAALGAAGGGNCCMGEG